MPKTLTESEIEATLAKLKAADPDKKVDIIQFFGLQLEDVEELPANVIDPFLLILPPLIRTPHSLLLSSVLSSFLPYFLPLIPKHPTTHLRLALLQVLPALLEKLNDAKERIHSAASNAIVILGELSWEAEPPVPASNLNSSGSLKAGSLSSSTTTKSKPHETLPHLWERHLKDVLQGKAWRSKVEGMKVLTKVRSKEGAKMGLKAWLGILVDLLEDGDGNVRDQARETVVELLSPSSTPPAARSEFKRLLVARNVRKTIADDIITRILSGEGSDRSTPAVVNPEVGKEEGASKSGAATPALSQADDVDVVYIASPQDLEREFHSMLPFFEGKETEENWAPRERSIVRIRGMMKGQAHVKYQPAFIAGLKGGIVEGVSKTVLSLRTTVAQQSCYLLKELPEGLGAAFDNFVEFLLPILGKMSGFTKKLIADRSQTAVTSIITHTTVHPRIFINHIASGIQEKNVQTRAYSANHLKTFLIVHASHAKHQIDATSGLSDTLDGAFRKALADVNPGVREVARQAFWRYYEVWRSKAEVLMNSLDGQARKQLEKANPRTAPSPMPTYPSSSTRSAPSSATTKPPSKKMDLKAMLAERRRAVKEAGKRAQETNAGSPRVVSNPVSASPGVQHASVTGLPRSSSAVGLARHIESSSPSPVRSPTPSSSVTRTRPSPSPKPTQFPIQTKIEVDSPLRSRSTSLTPDLARSPPKLPSPPLSSGLGLGESPLRQVSTYHGRHSVGEGRRAISEFVEVAGNNAESEADVLTLKEEQKSGDEGNTDQELPPAVQDEVEQVEQSQQLEPELEQPESQQDNAFSISTFGHAPSTPIRSIAIPTTTPLPNSRNRNINREKIISSRPNSEAFQTPLNPKTSALRSSGDIRSPAWKDSPRPEAVTPQMMQKLKERRHERSWWVKRQELLEKASPLKSLAPSPSSAILPDIEALESGAPTLKNLQKIALFCNSHPVRPESIVEEDEEERGAFEGEKRVWEGLFGRVMDGLIDFLRPDKDKELLEQGLVVLWEIVQHQWPLVDGTQRLCHGLFRLRESRDAVVLESTNALISLLVQISDPMLLLFNLRSSLDRFLTRHPAPSSSSTDSSDPMTSALSQLSLSSSKESPEKMTRNSGYLFGLTSIGMCVLRLSAPVVVSEGPKLGQIVMEAITDPSSIIRQAAYSLLLAIQCVTHDSRKTLAFVPAMLQGQKDLAVHYMAQNGILEQIGLHKKATCEGETEREDDRDNMTGELTGLMSRGVIRE
ncbi:protein STU1 [Cryptococcus neoformans]|uniref:Protein STU1 n=1 Tax=Cryptococcus neoformans Tu259-1 TaxID=1230072 RepID=A0A854QJ43_CRYNE|nr:protein STU1 [Cryptococcus neoformans var. grubii Tu259-1]OXG52402.1 protein STU1 [Cryptococcus neoformans var. grubii Th84]OXH15810.1 protein STU1 [Cryptococcus neoformans var. grubii]OXH36106.1 protein STU1 [Cryptococcus neoformans var. grubii]OXH56902.1 protein STU1 [Cryptococcus neoformans var. grubii]